METYLHVTIENLWSSWSCSINQHRVTGIVRINLLPLSTNGQSHSFSIESCVSPRCTWHQFGIDYWLLTCFFPPHFVLWLQPTIKWFNHPILYSTELCHMLITLMNDEIWTRAPWSCNAFATVSYNCVIKLMSCNSWLQGSCFFIYDSILPCKTFHSELITDWIRSGNYLKIHVTEWNKTLVIFKSIDHYVQFNSSL